MAALIDAIEAGGGGGDDAAIIDSLIDKSITEISSSRVTSIANYAFYQCGELKTADFPTVKSIGTYAFEACKSLTTANIPATTSISNYAFYYCSSLTTTDFPDATSIGVQAFCRCSSLTTADFPVAESIDAKAFYYCSKLTALILRKTYAVCRLLNTNAFNSTPIASGTGYIYVPSALVDRYKAATNWATYADQIRAIEDYPDITGGAA